MYVCVRTQENVTRMITPPQVNFQTSAKRARPTARGVGLRPAQTKLENGLSPRAESSISDTAALHQYRGAQPATQRIVAIDLFALLFLLQRCADALCKAAAWAGLSSRARCASPRAEPWISKSAGSHSCTPAGRWQPTRRRRTSATFRTTTRRRVRSALARLSHSRADARRVLNCPRAQIRRRSRSV